MFPQPPVSLLDRARMGLIPLSSHGVGDIPPDDGMTLSKDCCQSECPHLGSLRRMWGSTDTHGRIDRDETRTKRWTKRAELLLSIEGEKPKM